MKFLTTVFYRIPLVAASAWSGQCAYQAQNSEVALFTIGNLPC